MVSTFSKLLPHFYVSNFIRENAVRISGESENDSDRFILLDPFVPSFVSFSFMTGNVSV